MKTRDPQSSAPRTSVSRAVKLINERSVKLNLRDPTTRSELAMTLYATPGPLTVEVIARAVIERFQLKNTPSELGFIFGCLSRMGIIEIALREPRTYRLTHHGISTALGVSVIPEVLRAIGPVTITRARTDRDAIPSWSAPSSPPPPPSSLVEKILTLETDERRAATLSTEVSAYRRQIGVLEKLIASHENEINALSISSARLNALRALFKTP